MKHPIPADFANRIKQLRTDAGMSQAGLAEKIGVTPAAVAQWESGRAQPSWKRWQQIVRAEALGMHALVETFQAVKESGVGFVVQAPPQMDFSGDPEVVRLVTEGYRLNYGHQVVNPARPLRSCRSRPCPTSASPSTSRCFGSHACVFC